MSFRCKVSLASAIPGIHLWKRNVISCVFRVVFLLFFVLHVSTLTSQALQYYATTIFTQQKLTSNEFHTVRSTTSTATARIGLRMAALMMMMILIMSVIPIPERTTPNPLSSYRLEFVVNQIHLASRSMLFTRCTKLFVGYFSLLWIDGPYVDWQIFGWFFIEALVYEATGRIAEEIETNASTLKTKVFQFSRERGKITHGAVVPAIKLMSKVWKSNNTKKVHIVSCGASFITGIESNIRVFFGISRIGTVLVQIGLSVVLDNLSFVAFFAIICCVQVAGLIWERGFPSKRSSIKNNADHKVCGCRVVPVNGVAPRGDKGDSFRSEEKKQNAASFAGNKVSATAKRDTGVWLDQSTGARFVDIPQGKSYERGTQASRGKWIDPFCTAPFDFENHLRPLFTSESIKVRTTRSQNFSELGKFGMREQTRADA